MAVPLPPPHMARTWFAAAAVCGLILSACGERTGAPGPAGAPEAQAVKLVPVQTRAADRYVEITGTLYGEEEVSISAEVPGRVVEIHAELGDTVPHGGQLAQIDPTDFQLAFDEQNAALIAALAKLGLEALPATDIELSRLPLVARAEAEESNAKARLDRARRLYERTPPLLSEQDFADIQTRFEVASTSAAVERLNARSLLSEARVKASALRTAQQRLNDTRVLAPPERPLNYRVAARNVSVGEVVAEGQPLYRLVATDRVKFRGLVPERYAQQVVAGAKAQLIVDTFPKPFDAAVARVSPAVDVATRSFEVEILADNPEGRLKPGSFMRARILIGTQADARFVPESAVTQFAGVQRVFSVKDGKVVEHRVELREAADGFREVISGLDGIEQVIDTPRGIRTGAAVATAP